EVDSPGTSVAPGTSSPLDRVTARVKKLGFREQRELEALPATIEALEKRLNCIQEQISQPHFYTQAHDLVRPILDELQFTQEQIDQSMRRWAELDDRSQEFQRSRLEDRS
ncbi:MAG TPA: hypothetical protein VLB07_15990, partial [Woeseiaceae bacterium]|nr:hypothetical protein [Woeseiaceae bacterium]